MMKAAIARAPRRVGRQVLQGLLDLRPSQQIRRKRVVVEEAAARAVTAARVFAFASADYPGAALSILFDSDGTTAVGGFIFDPTSGTSPATAFTFAGGAYQILTVPGANVSIATGINGAGVVVGVYEDLG